MKRKLLFGNKACMGSDAEVAQELEECDRAEAEALREEEEREAEEAEAKKIQKRSTKGKGFMRFDSE